jgi:hypothetical protein
MRPASLPSSVNRGLPMDSNVSPFGDPPPRKPTFFAQGNGLWWRVIRSIGMEHIIELDFLPDGYTAARLAFQKNLAR